MASAAVLDAWYALGDPTRREVLAIVAERPQSVGEIAARLPVSRPAVSQHLRVLSEARLVSVQPAGRQRIYRVESEGLEPVRADLDRFWSQTLTNFKRIAEQAESEGAP